MNNNIFNYFVDKFAPKTQPQRQRLQLEPYQETPVAPTYPRVNELLNPPPQPQQRPRIMPPTVDGMNQPTAEQRIDLSQPMPEQQYQQNPNSLQIDGYQNELPTRPRTLPNVEQPKLSPQQEMQDRIILSRNKIDELSNKDNPNYQPVENNDKGDLGRLKDIAREAVIGAGQSYNQTGSLESAIGGGIAGALGGGFRPTLNEERERGADIQQERIRLGDYENQSKQMLDASQAEAERIRTNAQTQDILRKPEKN